jgi:hypothetical protein
MKEAEISFIKRRTIRQYRRIINPFLMSIYNDVIQALKDKISPQKAIDFNYLIEKRDKFGNLHVLCERLGLRDITEFQYYYNEEIICQVYTTVFVEEVEPKWFWWKTENHTYRGSLSDLAEALGITMAVGNADERFIRLHDDDPKKPTHMAMCYHPTKSRVVFGHIGGLLEGFDILHRIFR